MYLDVWSWGKGKGISQHDLNRSCIAGKEKCSEMTIEHESTAGWMFALGENIDKSTAIPAANNAFPLSVNICLLNQMQSSSDVRK